MCCFDSNQEGCTKEAPHSAPQISPARRPSDPRKSEQSSSNLTRRTFLYLRERWREKLNKCDNGLDMLETSLDYYFLNQPIKFLTAKSAPFMPLKANSSSKYRNVDQRKEKKQSLFPLPLKHHPATQFCLFLNIFSLCKLFFHQQN